MGCRLIRAILALVAVFAFAPVLLAQTPEPSAAPKAPPAPAAPDLTGVWRQYAPPGTRTYALYSFSKDEPPMTPWGEARFKAAKPSFGPRAVGDSNDPTNPTTGNSIGCSPPGVPRIYLHPFPMEIIQIPGRVIMLFEFDHFVRQIWTDGRGHDENMPPLWMGDSIGKWEGDTLVVDTTNFNDKTWFDRGGHPHSDQLHLVERIRRTDKNTLEIAITVDDPKAYTKPWTGKQFFQLKSDWHVMEMICVDNVNFLDLQKKVTEAPKP